MSFHRSRCVKAAIAPPITLCPPAFESVVADLSTVLDLFPRSKIVGDDQDWGSVRRDVQIVTAEPNLRAEASKSAWRIVRIEKNL